MAQCGASGKKAWFCSASLPEVQVLSQEGLPWCLRDLTRESRVSWSLSDSSAPDQQQGLEEFVALKPQVFSPGKWEQWCLPSLGYGVN